MVKNINHLPLILSSLAMFFLGIFFGLIWQINNDTMLVCPVSTVEKEKICSLDLYEVSPFGIKGKINGNKLIFFAGKNSMEISPEEVFQFNTSEVFRNIKASIPDGMKFFASEKGEVFYPVENTNKLEDYRPENLVFFKSKEEAISKGFREAS